jgi:hypothetical protein
MKILFLDIDGVLNSEKFYKNRVRVDGVRNEIDQCALKLLERILEKTGCLIVLSSTWRLSQNYAYDLLDSGLQSNMVLRRLIGRTPHMPRPMGTGAEYCERGKEIEAWLKANPNPLCNMPTSCPFPARAMCSGHKVEKYAILDDDSDFLPDQPLFKTSWKEGLTEEIADKIIQYLTSTEA